MRLNGEDIGEFEGSLDEFLNNRGIRREGIAVAIDGEVVPRSQWLNTQVTDVSDVEVVTAAAGG